LNKKKPRSLYWGESHRNSKTLATEKENLEEVRVYFTGGQKKLVRRFQVITGLTRLEERNKKKAKNCRKRGREESFNKAGQNATRATGIGTD